MSDILNKYRPELFKDIFGNKVVIERLKELISTGSKSHNVLLHGLPGTGKTTLALAFARELGATELNIYEYQLRGVNDVREIVDTRLSGAPIGGLAKVIVANESQFLTPDAQVELLTPTERSFNPYLSFVFTTTSHPNKFDKALRARFIHLETKPLTARESLQLLGFLSTKENVILDMSVVKKIIELAGGIPRELVLLFDSVFRLENKEQQLERLTKSKEEEEGINAVRLLARAIQKKDEFAAIEILEQNVQPPESIRLGLCNFFRGCLVQGIKSREPYSKYINLIETFSKGYYEPILAKTLLYKDVIKSCGE